jgi:hypothetical protein
MKNLKNLTFTGFLLSLFLLSSCVSMNDLTISVTEPAPVNIPSYIKKVGVVNRTMPSEKKNKLLDKADKIISLEGMNLDKEGANEALLGLHDELGKNGNFIKVKIIESQSKNPGLGIFPAPLPWDTITKICADNDVDALFVLSLYDTEATVNYQSVPIEIAGPLGVKIPALEHNASISTLIKTGWRIYDPINKVILDEFVMNQTQLSSGRGINPIKAAEAIMGRKEAVMHLSRNIGQTYAQRILPFRIRVRREYYVRGTPSFRIAMRRARIGDWDGAAQLWQKEVKNRKRRVAGRAHYNMAIISEINGDLETAVNWASKSYTDYRNKNALRYQRILRNRIARNQELQRQMKI